MIGCYCKSFFFNATLNYDVTVLFLAPRSEIILLSAGESFYHDLKESRMQLACFVRKLLKYLENQVKSSNFHQSAGKMLTCSKKPNVEKYMMWLYFYQISIINLFQCPKYASVDWILAWQVSYLEYLANCNW